MANKIGIVLALDGEKEFTQGMKSAQQSAKLFDQELKNLDEKYKGSANSIEALTAKQEKLAEKQAAYARELESAKSGQKNAVDNYKKAGERLDELKESLEKAKSALRDMEDAGDTSSRAYRDQARSVEQLEKAVSRQSEEQAKASTNITKWDTAVAKAQGDVDRASSAVEKNAKYVDEAARSADGCAKSIDRMGQEASEAAGDVEKVSVSLGDMVKAKAVDLAGDAVRELGEKAIEAAKYVVEVGSSFEASMSKVEALSGASSAQLEQMSQKAQELGSSTKFSATAVADGFSYMALAGWDANQSIAAIDGIVNLAAASEMDLAQASDMVTDYLSAFGMEASRAGEMADMMAYAQANSNTSTQQLGEAFGNCAANMNAAGQDMKTTTSFLEAFANQGIKGSEAGTKLSAIMRDITAKMQDGAIQIGNTSVAVTDSEGNFRDLTDIMIDVEAATEGMGTAERSAALAATFTSRSVGGLNMILAEGMGNIAGYEQALENCDGAAAEMAGTMQNNLQGAITEMNSAAEGLGIALYDKVKGPLTDAVRLATELLSGITDAITPELSTLQQFNEQVKAANEQTQASISNANAALDKGAADVAKIDSLAGIITSANEQFSIFAETDVSGAAENVSETAAGMEQPFSDMEEAAKTAKNGIEELNKADTSGASDDLAETASSMGNSEGTITEGIESTKQSIEGLGEVDTSGASDTVRQAAENISASGEQIQADTKEAKNSIEAIGEAELTTENLQSELRNLGSATSEAAAEMDEFTKFQVRAAINELAQQIPALADAWDEVTGTLKITEEEFNSLIDAQKRAVMEASFEKAKASATEAWAESLYGLKMAQDGATAAQREFDEFCEKTGLTTETASQAAGVLADEFYTLQGNVGEANEALRIAGENHKGAAEAMARADAVAEELANEYGFVGNEAKETANATEEAASAVKGFAGDEAEAAAAAHASQQEIVSAHQSAADQIREAYESAKQAAMDAFSVNPFDEWAQNAEQGMSAMQAAFDSQLEGMANYAENLQEISRHVGTEITPEFLQYLENLGTGGAQAVQDLADAFKRGDTGAIEELMNSFTSAMDKQDEIANMMALDALAFKTGLNEFGSSASEWQGLDEALSYISQFGDGVSEETASAFDRAARTAQAAGVKIPEGLKEGIEKGTENPEQAVAQATEKIQAAIEGHAAGMLQAAQDAGIQVDQSIIDGINAGGDETIRAYAALVEQLGGSAVELAQSAGTEAGAGMASGTGQGIAEGQGEATSAAEAMVSAAAESAIAIEGQFSDAGMNAAAAFSHGVDFMANAAQTAGQTLANAAQSGAAAQADTFNEAGNRAGTNYVSGVNSMQDAANGAGQAVASSGKNGASANSNWNSEGVSAGSSYASGVSSQSGSAYSAGASLASSGRSGASSGGSWYSIGANMAAGVAQGINAAASSVATAAANMVSNAMAAARAAADINSPSKLFMRGLGEPIGEGVAKGIENSTPMAEKAIVTQIETIEVQATQYLANNKKKIEKVGETLSGHIIAGYGKKTADELIKNNFGVSDTKTTGSGKNKTTVKKSGSEFSADVLDAAQSYFKNMQIMYDVSAEEEATYWEKVRHNLRYGSQAWYDATKLMKDAKEDAKEAEVKADEEILSNMEQTISRRKELGKTYSPETEVKLWQGVMDQVERGSDVWYDALKKQNDAKEQIADNEKKANEDILSAGEDYIKRRQALGEISATAEATYWKDVRKNFEKGSAEYIDITEKINDAQSRAKSDVISNAETYVERQKILNQMSASDEAHYWKSIKDSLEKGSDDWFTALEKMQDAQERADAEMEQTRSENLSKAEAYVEHQKILGKMSASDEESYWRTFISTVKKGSDDWYAVKQKINTAHDEAVKDQADANAKMISNAENYVEKQKAANKMSLGEEFSYWELFRAHFKKGSDEFKEITDKMNAARKQMSAEEKEVYSNIVKNAKQYVSDLKAVNKMSLQEELAYWQNIIQQVKKGSDQYKEAKQQILSIKAEIGTVSVAQSLLGNYQTYFDMSEKAEMQYWNTVRKNFKAGTAERIQADSLYFAAREKYYAKLKSLDEKYYSDRAKIIEDRDTEIAEIEKDRDEDIAEAQQKQDDTIRKAAEKRADAVAKAEKTKAEKIEKVNKDLTKKLKEIDEDLDEQINGRYGKWEEFQKSQNEYLAQLKESIKEVNTGLTEDIKEANKQLNKDIDSVKKKLTQDIANAIKDRARELVNAFDLFDTFESQSATGEELLFNLKAQAAGYKDWAKEIENLGKRGILNADLIQELTERGPQDSAAVHALNMLSDAQLREYNTAYLEKEAVAIRQAQKEDAKGQLEATNELRKEAADNIQSLKDSNKAEVESLRKEAAQKIADLQAGTKQNIDKLRASTEEAIEKLKYNAEKSRKEAADSTNEAIYGTEGYIAECNASVKEAEAEEIATINQVTQEITGAEAKGATTLEGAIDALKTATGAQVAGLEETAAGKIDDAKKAATASLADLKATWKDDKTRVKTADINSDIQGLAKNIRSIAEDQTDALVSKFTSLEGAVKGAEKSIGESVSKAIAAKADTKAEKASGTAKAAKATGTKAATGFDAMAANVTNAIGGTSLSAAMTASQNATNGVAALSANVAKAISGTSLAAALTASQNEAILNAIKGGKSRSKKLTADEEKSHHALWKYIVSKYGRTPTTAMYKSIADQLGVKTSKTPTTAEKNAILAALKKRGLRSGSRSIDEFFAWMDEQGIGSEMIVRQSDGARLNTSVKPGDAIIPAESTANLWEWSKLVPEEFARVASGAALNARVMREGGMAARSMDAVSSLLDGMYALMSQYMPFIAEQKTLSVDGRKLATATAGYTSNIFAMKSRRRRR